MKHAGMGWSNGAITGGNGRILALPSPALLMLGSEHWHHDEAVRAGKRVLFRGMARQGFRPAELGWNVKRYVDEILRDAVRVSEPIADFVGWNEWNLQDERGDQRADDGNLTDLFGLLGSFQRAVIGELRQRPVTRKAVLHFGAWAPKDETDYTALWKPAADLCDVVDVHAYGQGEGIIGHIEKYRALFPDKPIHLTEWHSDGAGPDQDRHTLELLADYSAKYPWFHAHYFLWRWDGAPSHQRDLADAIRVEGNPSRLALFQHPPIAAVPAPPVEPPVPDPEPAPEPDPPQSAPGVPEPFPLPTWGPAPVDIIDGCVIVADEYLIPRDLMLGLCLAESGEGLQSFDRWHRWTAEAMAHIAGQSRPGLQLVLDLCAAVQTNDISFGPCHQTWYWWDEYPGNHQPGDPHQYNLDEILAFRKRLIEDHGYALRLAAGKVAADWAKYGPDRVETLSRYNRPDGSASASVRARYAAMLALAPSMLPAGAPPLPEPAPPRSDMVHYEDYRDPEPAGRFAHTPKGIILHGSRSGNAGNSKAKEYLGTARYEVANTAGVGWHATIGENVVAIHLTPQEWAWNARGSSSHYLAVEFAQSTVDEPITDPQVVAFCAWVGDYVLPVWPGLQMHFPSHAELDGTPEYGPRDGKSDVWPKGDARTDDLRARIMAALELAPPSPSPLDALADRLELARASLDDGVARPTAAMLKAELLANIDQAWRNIDRVYAEIGAVGTELRRVGRESL